jgi:hypothetical protein
VSAEKVVRIKILPGEANEVSINGQRIERVVTGLAIDSNPRGTLVTLDLAVAGIDFEGEANVAIPARLRFALLAAGWVPPEQARALIRGDDPEPAP